MEWNNEKITSLIEDYHNSPALWNNKISAYKDNRIRNDKLKELANKYNSTVPELKKKIKNLRSAYYRERKKVLSKRRGSSPQKKSKWFAFEPLNFLSDIDLSKSTFSTADSDDEDFEGGAQDSLKTQYAQSEENVSENIKMNNKRARGKEESEKGIAPKKINKKDLSHLDREEEAYNNLKNACQRDDCSTYGEHVANELRNLCPRAQTIAKHMINNALFEAAMGKYDDEATLSTFDQNLETSKNLF